MKMQDDESIAIKAVADGAAAEQKKKVRYDLSEPAKEERHKIDEGHLIKTIVIGSDWEEVLENIIQEENINPWDVDIVKLVDAFMDYIYNLKKFDFRVPARFILIAAILLRLKCEALVIREQKGKEEKPVQIDVNVPLLDMPIVRVPRKKVTLTDLVDALNKAVEFTERKQERKLKVRRTIENLINPVEDIEVRIQKVYDEVREKDIRKFSDLVEKWDNAHIVNKFIPLLHLATDGKLFCDQKELFGEIFIILEKPQEIGSMPEGQEPAAETRGE
jgi:segregation and condensation protein A